MGVGHFQIIWRLFDVIADKIDHFRICPAFRCGEGQAADRADELLELICIAGIDGPVTGIMGTRCQLIDQDFAGLGSRTSRWPTHPGY